MSQTRRVVSKKLDLRVAPSFVRGRLQPGFGGKGKSLSQAKQADFDLQAEKRAKEALSTLSSGTKRKIQEITGAADDEVQPDDGDRAWDDVDDDEPMDERVELTAEGEEAEYLQEYVGLPRRAVTQTWASRITTASIRWTEQLDNLVNAYLEFKHAPVDAVNLGGAPFTLPVVDIFDYSDDRLFYQIPGSTHVNITLMKQGYLGTSPTTVYSAFSLRSLELYRHLRIRQPRLSIQAWLKVICDYHEHPYRRALWQQFTDVFDIYLRILNGVQARLNSALGRTAPDWRVKHSCPPCQYKLHDEPPLEVSILGVFDGNSSLKRVQLREGLEADPRQFQSNYYIPESEVDQFKDEVKSRKPAKDRDPQPAAKDMAAADGDGDGDPVPDPANTSCTGRWQAAMSDSHKRMWAIYRETGVFLAACRHAIIWWICDMVRSGELAKYPLAIINRILNTFAEDAGIGYDVACSFLQTIAQSSLADDATRKRLRMVVNAFHGWAHNRHCQLHHHPLYVTGFGIEDLETCERIFSSSNSLATITRYASQFHRHQAIDMFARAWDDDKYQELSSFILNNYKQVGQILRELPEAIAALQSGKSAADCDYAHHLEAERQYLTERRGKPVDDDWQQHYVELLRRHQEATRVFEQALSLATNPIRHSAVQQQSEVARDHAYELLQQLTEMVHAVESKRGIRRWSTDSEEYKRASESVALRNYRKALDKLEGLVVQWLFELTKLGLSGTGYKLRTHINKSLKTRCRAIQTALRKFNEAARAIGRSELDWSDVSTYGSLAEFELLRECNTDIRALPWADSRNRQAANHTFKIERAKEERVRLNVEVARLATWIRDEEADTAAAIKRLEEAGEALLAAELRVFGARRKRINNIHRVRIQKVHQLPWFTGSMRLGQAIEREGADGDVEMPSAGLENVALDDEDGRIDAAEDDQAAAELDALNVFMENLAVIEDGMDDNFPDRDM